jgi:hypothetical protein
MIDFDLKSYAKRIAPTGEYIVRVMGSDLKHTKANNGSRYLEVRFKIVEGPMAGVFLAKKFNIYNASETAERMARESFCAFCDNACVPNIKSYAELEGATLLARVSETYYQDHPKNEVDSFAKYEGTVRVSEAQLTAPPQLNDDIPF